MLQFRNGTNAPMRNGLPRRGPGGMSTPEFQAHVDRRESLNTACISDADGFRALMKDWRLLYDGCPGATPFNSWEWLFSWWQVYGEGRELRLLAWYMDKALVGVAPLYLATEKTQLGTACRVLRFVGDGSFDSDYLSLLARPDARTFIARRFGEWLCANREWHALQLRELPETSGLPEVMRELASRVGLQCRLESGRCGAVDLASSFDEYLRARQSRFRTKIRSLLRRLEEERLVFESRSEPRDLRRRLRSLFALHQGRWQEVGAPGVFGAAAKRRFYVHFVPRFARRGWLRLYSLRKGTSYLAHQLCFGHDGTTYLLQEGFDISNPASSYGQMLRAAVLRHLIQHGEARYDFLGGISKHKEDWGAREGKVVHLVIARKQWRGWLYFNLPVWRERLAVEAKRVLPAGVVRWLRRAVAPTG